MARLTKQMLHWSGTFGAEYTKRNHMTVDQMEALWVKNYGFSRSSVNQRFLDGFDKSMRILEVGSNIGNQLLCLRRQGFRNLYGVELQHYPLVIARANFTPITFIQASAFQLPFRSGFFDLVFTSGLLIHIAPEHISQVIGEIHRCTKRYIWGVEYYATEYTIVPYRGHNGLCWKADFAKLFIGTFGDLTLRRQEFFNYLDSGNIDTMYLLEKNTRNP